MLYSVYDLGEGYARMIWVNCLGLWLAVLFKWESSGRVVVLRCWGGL